MKGTFIPVFGDNSILYPESEINRKSQKALQKGHVKSLAIFAQNFYGLNETQINALKQKALGDLNTDESGESGDLTSILQKAVIGRFQALQKDKPVDSRDVILERLRATLTGGKK